MAEDGQVSQLPESRKTPEIPARSYKYHPLPSTDSIRLLELQPGTGLQELRCKLSIVNMSGLSGYEALSYSLWLPIFFLQSMLILMIDSVGRPN